MSILAFAAGISILVNSSLNQVYASIMADSLQNNDNILGDRSNNPASSAGPSNTVTIVVPAGSGAQQVFEYYQPNPAQVSSGATVMWYNQDSTIHTATANDGSFDTGNINPGANSLPIVLTEQGQISYHCNFHPYMTGSIQVIAMMSGTNSDVPAIYSNSTDIRQLPPDRQIHLLNQALMVVQTVKADHQLRAVQLDELTILQPDARQQQILYLQQNIATGIQELQNMMSMQPEQQQQRLHELLNLHYAVQPFTPSIAQQQALGIQIVQGMMALEPPHRLVAFSATIEADTQYLRMFQAWSQLTPERQLEAISTVIPASQQAIQALAIDEANIQQLIATVQQGGELPIFPSTQPPQPELPGRFDNGNLIGSNQSATGNLLLTYTDPTYGITFQYPSNWQQIETSFTEFPITDPVSPRAIVALAPNDNKEEVQVLISVRNLPSVLGQFNDLTVITNLETEAQRNLGSTILDTSSTMVGGNEASEIVYVSGTFKNRLLITLIGERQFTIHYSAPEGQLYDTYLPGVQLIQDSFTMGSSSSRVQ
jgi:plastocyanin